MQIKLKTIVVAAAVTLGGAAYAQEMVVKIGHVGPTSGAIAIRNRVGTVTAASAQSIAAGILDRSAKIARLMNPIRVTRSSR